MKKIVIAISSLYGGGAERVASIWANQLSHKGYQVSIVVMYRELGEYIVDNEITIQAIAPSKDAYLQQKKKDRIKILRRIIKKINADCIISFLPNMQMLTWIACLGLGIERIETVRNNPDKMIFNSSGSKMLWMICMFTASKVIAQTEEQKKMLPYAIQKRTKVIFNPVNEIFVKKEMKDYKAPVTQFVAAGRINPQKNYELMIRAFSVAHRYCPDIQLHIYGTGEAKHVEALSDMIFQLGCSEYIFFEGRSNTLHFEYDKYQAYILSSDFEGLPNALAEAMVSKLICISTNCPTGPSELIDNRKTGFLVPVADEKSLTAAIIEVVYLSKLEQQIITNNAVVSVLSKCASENIIHQLVFLIER